jgi:hypothetical protein
MGNSGGMGRMGEKGGWRTIRIRAQGSSRSSVSPDMGVETGAHNTRSPRTITRSAKAPWKLRQKIKFLMRPSEGRLPLPLPSSGSPDPGVARWRRFPTLKKTQAQLEREGREWRFLYLPRACRLGERGGGGRREVAGVTIVVALGGYVFRVWSRALILPHLGDTVGLGPGCVSGRRARCRAPQDIHCIWGGGRICATQEIRQLADRRPDIRALPPLRMMRSALGAPPLSSISISTTTNDIKCELPLERCGCGWWQHALLFGSSLARTISAICPEFCPP